MKPRLYPFRLFKQDQVNRQKLVSHYREQRGRPVDFATILRELMSEKVNYDELMHLNADGIRALAVAPRPFVLIDPTAVPEPQLARDWQQAAEAVAREYLTKAAQRIEDAAAGGPDRLNRATLDFIREGASVGDRHRLLFSAAANLGEFDCPPRLACALLMPSALDSGLTPADAVRQIECGLKCAATPERGC